MAVMRTRFLRPAIDSVFAQDYPNVEVVLIDDGSTEPEMAPLLEEYATKHPGRFRFERQGNQGQPRTINRGMELAEGEFAGYLSDDDLLYPEAVSKQIAALQADPDAVLVYAGYDIIDEQDAVLDTILSDEHSLADSLRLHDPFVGAGAFYRTETFREIGGWDTELAYRGDYACWLRMGLHGSFVRVPESLSGFRLHSKGRTVSDAGVTMARESLAVIDKFYARDDLPPEAGEVKAEAYRNAFIQAAMVMSLGRSDPKERFYVFDRHMPKISEAARKNAPTPDVLLNIDVVDLERQVSELHEQLVERDARLIQREEVIAYLGRPWWWRAARRLTPDGLRPLAKRVGARLRPGRVGS